ncbi:MAG: Hpt domain-containing protein [Candidatus Acidiferrales bacterium]|jgi:two-component system chemotaxis sensor kinase CheA
MSDEIVREFLVEGNENLDTLDRELIQLERDPHNRATLASVFRTIHTIKGTCGFLGFTKLEAVAHVGENLLSKLRDAELVLNPEITTALLRMVDAVRQMLQSIEATGSEGERDDKELIVMLTRVTQAGSPERWLAVSCGGSMIPANEFIQCRFLAFRQPARASCAPPD